MMDHFHAQVAKEMKNSSAANKLRSLTTPLMANPSAASPLTIFYTGKLRVYNAIPREKQAQAIMLIAAAAAKASTTAAAAKALPAAVVGPRASYTAAAALGPVLTRCLSLQSSTAGGAQPPVQPQLIDSDSTALCKLQAELPMARRHSLQSFLEKRRDRLNRKAPYASVKPAAMEGASEGRPSQLT